MQNTKIKKLISKFNSKVKVGDLVKYTPAVGEPKTYKTTSEAWEMCGSGVVRLDGISGCIDIEFCQKV